MLINNRKINQSEPPFIIAEIAQTHDGSLGSALSFIDVAKDCGADAVKFQTHIASEESTPDEPWRIKFSYQDKTRYDYWKRMEFSLDQWKILKDYADSRGIIFLSSPFSIKACEWLKELGVPAWKIASGEVNNSQILEWVSNSGLPVIISSGLMPPNNVISLIQKLKKEAIDVAVLHCTTKYPTPPEDIGMNIFEVFLAQLKGVPVGLSDHSGSIVPSIIATYLGASIIEVHLTLHPKMFGPDVSSSLVPEQLANLVQCTKEAWIMKNKPIDKLSQLSLLEKEKTIFGRSLYTKTEVAMGDVISDHNISYKKPGGGISYEERSLVIGKKAKVDLPKNHRLETDNVY